MKEHAARLCHGVTPLTGKTWPWMEDLLSDPEACAGILRDFGSPVNLLDFGPLADNVARLREVADDFEVPLQIHIARKANKAAGLIDAALSAGAGVDVASLRELQQSLDAGMPAERIIVSAAVKEQELLRLAIETGAVISADNLDELDDILTEAARQQITARLALRLAIATRTTGEEIPPTRFGMTPETWISHLSGFERTDARLRIEGLHFHLNGYAVADRVAGLAAACDFVPRLRALGHPVSFVDIGGGFPMRYLESEEQWREFWRELAAEQERGVSRLTWRGDDLGLADAAAERPSPETYPFWQPLDAAAWLREVLEAELPGEAGSVAAELRRLALDLHCEPGRAMLEGCGMTVARVAFRKESSDGEPLIGLFMNRTQLRSTSRDVLIDPRLVRPEQHRAPSDPVSGFLVGAYCIEEELILRRRIVFPAGVSRDDTVAFVNTAGYLMHILESPSHQIPLAATVVRTDTGWRRDRGDLREAAG